MSDKKTSLSGMSIYDVENLADLFPDVKLSYRIFFIIAAVAAVVAAVLLIVALATGSAVAVISFGAMLSMAAAYGTGGLIIMKVYKSFDESELEL